MYDDENKPKPLTTKQLQSLTDIVLSKLTGTPSQPVKDNDETTPSDLGSAHKEANKKKRKR